MHPGQPGAVIQAAIGGVAVVMVMMMVVVMIAMGVIMAMAMAVIMGMVMIMMVIMPVIMAVRLIFNGRGPATTDGTHHSTSNSFTRRSSPPVIWI